MAAQVCLPLDKEGAEVSITLSLGIAVMRDGDRFETLLARAETAMRRAKVAGRNRVEVA